MRLALAGILTGLLTCTATAANGPKTDVVQAGPWRIPLAGEFTSERDERGLHLTGRDGHRISVLFLTSERPSERGEGARRRVETAASLEREWLRVAGEVSDVIRQGPVVRQLTAGRTLVSMKRSAATALGSFSGTRCSTPSIGLTSASRGQARSTARRRAMTRSSRQPVASARPSSDDCAERQRASGSVLQSARRHRSGHRREPCITS
jgi:hypothetical protein